MRRVLPSLLLACLALGARADVFDTWLEGLLRLQVEGRRDAAFDGNFLCPACAAFHGRAGDAVWPLTWQALTTGDRRCLARAEQVIAWAEANVIRADGSCVNDIGDSWRGITVFLQTSLGRTLLFAGDRLPSATRARWLDLFRRTTAWLKDGWMDAPKPATPNINYRATYALAMEYARKILGDPDGAYRASGDRQAALVLGAIGSDGLITGEARPLDYVSPRGFRAVDFGYNLEETLPSLCQWVELRGDDAARKRIRASAEAHLAFLLPDGAIDNSAGTRNCKWTYWGSRTSDGVLEVLSFLEREGHAEAGEYARRVVAQYERCTDPVRGLLAGGPHAAASGEPVCVHHTFCHLKMMPVWRESGWANGACRELPRKDGVTRYPTDGVSVVRTGAWRATCWASDLIPASTAGNAFGSATVTLLHHEAYGPVFAQSALEWRAVERRNMQEPRLRKNDVLTVQAWSADGTRATGFDDEAKGEVTEGADGIRFATRARLCRRGEPPGDEVRLDWTFAPGGVTLEATADAACVLRLPLVGGKDRTLAVAGNEATVDWAGGRLVVRATRPLERFEVTSPDGRAYTTQSGLQAFPLAVRLPQGERVCAIISTREKKGIK